MVIGRIIFGFRAKPPPNTGVKTNCIFMAMVSRGYSLSFQSPQLVGRCFYFASRRDLIKRSKYLVSVTSARTKEYKVMQKFNKYKLKL